MEIIVTTPDQLNKLIKVAVRAGLDLYLKKKPGAAKNEPFLSVAQAAEILGISERSVIKQANERRLPFHTVGSRRKFLRSELMEPTE